MNYDCLRRAIGICGDGCTKDSKNAQCPNYYPCHCLGSSAEIITYAPWRAREIQSELLKKIEEQEYSPKPMSLTMVESSGD